MSIFQRLKSFLPRKRGPLVSRLKQDRQVRLFVEALEDRTVLTTAAHDLLGNLYVTGSFSGERDFGNGSTPAILRSTGAADVFVVKYDAQGDVVWAKSFAGTSATSSSGNGIAVDSAGGVYVTGAFQGKVDFDPSAGTQALTSLGGNDIFVAKLSDTGELVWAQSAGSTSDDQGNDIALDPSGKVWIAGSFQKSADFDPSANTAKRTSAGDYDAILWNLSATGQYVGAYQIGGSGNDRGNGLAIDASGNVLVTGWINDSADFDPSSGTKKLTSAGGGDAYVAKLSNTGTLVWAKTFGGNQDEKGAQVAVDGAGNVYSVGTFKGTADFDPSSATVKLTSAGSADDYLVKLDAAGNFVWARQMGGSGEELVQGLAVDASSTAYVAGTYRNTASFGPSIRLTSAGGQDAFVAAFNGQGNVTWARSAGGTSAETATGVTVDDSGMAYVKGTFSGTADFDAAGDGLLLKNTTAEFLWKLTDTGDVVWAEAIDTTPTVIVTPVASSLKVTGFPSSTTAGTSGTIVVQAVDASGNVVTGYRGKVHLTSTDGAALLPADYTFTAADAGVHSFTVTLTTAGTWSITATDTASSAIKGSVSNVKVNAAAASTFSLSDPSAAVSGTSFNITLTAKDAYGNLATGYTGTVRLSSSDGSAQLPANYTFTAGDAGVHTFNVMLKTAGSQSLTIADVANSALTATKSGIVVTSVSVPTATSFTVSAPSSVTAGAAFSITVSAKDVGGNVVTGYTGAVHFTSTDGSAVLPADYTFTAADGGVHTFTVTLKTTGSQSLTVTDKANGALIASVAGITVNVPPATGTLNPSLPPSGNFDLTDWKLTLPSGSSGSPTEIASPQLVAGYTSSYFYTGADGAMVFWAPVTGTTTSGSSYPRSELRETYSDGTLYNWNVVDGTATLDATLAVNQMPSTGKVVVGQIHDNGAGGISGQPLLKLVYDTSSGTGTLRALIRPTPTSTDSPSTTIATGIALNTQFSYQIELKADLTLSIKVNGVTKYSATIDASWKSQGMYFKAGSYVQDNVGTSTEGGRVSFYALAITHSNAAPPVTPPQASAASFVVSGSTAVTAGTPFNITVTVKDASGNVLPGYTGTVKFTSTDGASVLPATYTFTTADAGVHTFSVVMKAAGTWSVTATDTASSSVKGSLSSIKVSAAAASVFTIGAPTSATPGSAVNVTLTAKDAFGNIAAGYTGTVRLTSTDGAAGLPADYRFTTGDAGVHTFAVTLQTAGAQGVTITDTANSALKATANVTVSTVTPPPSSGTLNPNLPPSGNFDLTDWKLTLPSGSSGSPTEILSPQLVNGYSSQYFYTGADGAMVFWAPVTGVTTSGSSYPRSELRETNSDGSLYNWNLTDGTATLNATLAVNQMPSTGKLVIGQIHGNGAGGISGQPLIKLVYDTSSGTGTLRALIRPTPTSTDSPSVTIATGIPLNTVFSYQIQLKADGTLSVQYNGQTMYSAVVDAAWKTQGMYFKAGAYTQDNVGTSSEGGRVSFYALDITHV